jgi:hypothetical protein
MAPIGSMMDGAAVAAPADGACTAGACVVVFLEDRFFLDMVAAWMGMTGAGYNRRKESKCAAWLAGTVCQRRTMNLRRIRIIRIK